MTEYRLGAKPSRPDPRDRKFSALVALNGAAIAAAATAVDRKFYTMVNPDFRMNQGNEGTCVGHGTVNVLLAGPSPHPNFPAFASVEQAHQFSRKVYLDATGDTTYQNGAYPRDACRVVLGYGLSSSYWRVESIDDVVACLLTFGPCIMAVPWYNSMFSRDTALSATYGNSWVKVDFGSGLAGYHLIAATGIDMAPDNGAPPFVRWENSWGPNWLHGGTCRVSLESLRRLNLEDNWTFAEKEF